MELAETIDRSLHKGRTIELHYEDYTEEGTFKGTMTSLGCGAAAVGPVAVGRRGRIGRTDGSCLCPAVALLAVGGLLGFFLLLQLLMLVFRGEARR